MFIHTYSYVIYAHINVNMHINKNLHNHICIYSTYIHTHVHTCVCVRRMLISCYCGRIKLGIFSCLQHIKHSRFNTGKHKAHTYIHTYVAE